MRQSSLIHAYACVYLHPQIGQAIYNASSAQEAKFLHMQSMKDVFPDASMSNVFVHRLGIPLTSRDFAELAKKEGVPQLRCGRVVELDEGKAVLIGHQDNLFEVQFITGPCKGERRAVPASTFKVLDESQGPVLNAWTDACLAALGDKQDEKSQLRTCLLLAYDRRNSCVIEIAGKKFTVNKLNVFNKSRRTGKIKHVHRRTLESLPLPW